MPKLPATGSVKVNRYQKHVYEKHIIDKLRKDSPDGSVIQRQEALTFNQENGGSSPSRPTINRLIAKECQHCKQAMHIHRKGDEVTFAGCEPCIVDIRLERSGENEMTIKGMRSTKCVRCQSCKRRHLLSSFVEIEDGTGQK